MCLASRGKLDLGRNADLEKPISDITLSYMPPTTIANDMLYQHLGSILLVTDNPNDASAPRYERKYNLEHLGNLA